MVLRCTTKMLTLLRVAQGRVEEPLRHPRRIGTPTCSGIDGRKCLLIAHAGTLFTVIAPDVAVADLRPFGPFLTSRLHAELDADRPIRATR
ncbi:MAG: DUF6933 domain-containing protein [Sporichthyaceae bacterium]